ncbi:MAG: GAF domain-containing protein [Pseudomonadota bacterium]|nr:GAF domain-containing protein [Pseudomonadota bacterium]
MNDNSKKAMKKNIYGVLEQLNNILSSRENFKTLEQKLTEFSLLATAHLGDMNASNKPGSLKKGEKQFTVAGFFMHLRDDQKSILFAETGFPPEQHRLIIPDSLGHPGWVVKNEQPLLLENTDEHSNFEQILKTARMGSAMYSPLTLHGKFVGQFITASQARNTYDNEDFIVHQSLAGCASLVLDNFGWEAILSTINS